jgi:hypothetical protein
MELEKLDQMVQIIQVQDEQSYNIKVLKLHVSSLCTVGLTIWKYYICSTLETYGSVAHHLFSCSIPECVYSMFVLTSKL